MDGGQVADTPGQTHEHTQRSGVLQTTQALKVFGFGDLLSRHFARKTPHDEREDEGVVKDEYGQRNENPANQTPKGQKATSAMITDRKQNDLSENS